MWRKMIRPRKSWKAGTLGQARNSANSALEAALAGPSHRQATFGDDRRAAAEDVDALVLQPPDVEVAEVAVRSDGPDSPLIAEVRVEQVADEVPAEAADLAPEGREPRSRSSGSRCRRSSCRSSSASSGRRA